MSCIRKLRNYNDISLAKAEYQQLLEKVRLERTRELEKARAETADLRQSEA